MQQTNPKLAKAACEHEWTHLGNGDEWKYCRLCRLTYMQYLEAGSQEEAAEPRAARVCLKCDRTEEGWRYNRCPNCGEMADAPEDVCPVSPEELPACAAIRASANVYLAGKRHGDCIQAALELGLPKHLLQQGFMTNRGRFIDRTEALALMKAAGRASADPEGYRGGQLFSEDLY